MKLIFGIILTVSYVQAHSWLECTDYRIRSQRDREYYDKSLCKGYPRCGIRQGRAKFGVDTGFDFKPKRPNQCQCTKRTIASGGYSAAYNRPTYRPGQTVCLAYPPKNHVADPCKSNQFIPDRGVTIQRTRVNQANDDFSGRSYEHMNGKHQNGQVDYKGFQRCPKFCENPDKALCTMCFKLESDIAPGTYSFSWTWTFNVGELYRTCWDAVVEGASNPRPTPSRKPAPTPTRRPTTRPTTNPTQTPTRRPTFRPTKRPTRRPTKRPTKSPTRRPTKSPTKRPTSQPTRQPPGNSKCAAFYQSCTQRGTKCTQGSKCIWYGKYSAKCIPRQLAYRPCRYKGCPEGWTCKRSKYWASCVPARPKC